MDYSLWVVYIFIHLLELFIIHSFVSSRISLLLQLKELFDSIAPQITENRTVANSLPPFFKYSAKSLFLKRLYQTVENLKYHSHFE